MPRRRDLESICLIGSGPIVIGQACEFDYSGCQALKVLREDGFRTIVVNSNPATIMTDPGFADRTYLEPLDLEGVADVLARERPSALLPTMGGQTALNLAVQLAEEDVLAEPGALERRALELAEERDRALGALKELEFDHRTGKISDDDYRELVGPLRRRVAETLRALELRAESTEERVSARG